MYLFSLCVQPSHFQPQTQRCRQRNGTALTEAEKCAQKCDRNPHWLQNGIVWDNSGTNWQLQFCLSFCFFLFVWLAFEDCQSRYQKRTLLSYSLFSKRNLFAALQSHSISQIPKNSCWMPTHTHRLARGYVRKRQTNKIKQHQTVSKWKSVSFMDCVMLLIIFCSAWHSSDFLRQCRSDFKIRFW